MSDTFITVIVIFLAAILMFVFPLMAVSNTQDDVSKVAVQSAVSEFVSNVASKGKLTQEDYSALIAKINATGNSYDVQLEHKIMTVNPNKAANDQIGENIYYVVYNTAILEDGIDKDANGEYILKKGDYFTCTVKNTNTTMATQIKNFVYSIVGKDTYTIAASASALVVNTGSKS